MSNINERKQTLQTNNKEPFVNTSNLQYYFSQNKDLGGNFSKSDSILRKPGQQYWYEQEKTNKVKRLNLLKNLIHNNRRFQENLEIADGNDTLDERAYECAVKMKILPYIELWKNSFKDYLLSNFLPGMLSDHEFNIKSLNNYLRSSLNINISETIPIVITNNFIEEVDNKFNQFNYYNLSQPQNIAYDINEDNFLSVFFTEEKKISYLIKKIEDKIHNIKQHHKPINEKKIDNKLNKPFLFTNNDFTKITEDINYNNSHLEEHLNNIKNLLIQRIVLNKRFGQKLIRIENDTHSFLLK